MAEVTRDSFFGEDPANFTPDTHAGEAGTAVEFYFNEVTQKDYCRMHFAGDRQKIWDQPVREVDKRRFHQQWTLYKEGKDQLHGQTMLKTWGKIDDGSINMYEVLLFVKTVEQLAAFPDGNLINVPNSQQQLLLRHREMAREHVEAKRQTVGYDTAINAAERSQAVARQALEENQDLKAQLAELQRRMDAGPSVATDKPFPHFIGGVGRGARYRLSDGSEVVGKTAARNAQEVLNREPAEDRSEGV